MSKINFTFEYDSLKNSAQISNPYRLPISRQMSQHNIKILESARSTIFSTQNRCTQQSFDSIRKEMIFLWPTFQKMDDDSLQKYELMKDNNTLQNKIKRLSVLFRLLKGLKQLQKDKYLKKDLSKIQNCMLEFQRDCLNN